MDRQNFIDSIHENGFYIAQDVISEKQVKLLREATQNGIEKEAAFHGTVHYKDYGVLQACPMYGGEFLNLLENRTFVEPYNWVMGEGCIVYVYISSSMAPYSPNFSTRIHVDRPRVFKGYCECLGGLVLLNDFDEENGATYFLPGSHNRKNRPSKSEFYKKAEILKARAGSVFYFNLRLWHSGGENKTNNWRHALAIGMTRPYIKQRFDLPKLIEKYNVDISGVSDYAKQKLGFFAVQPSTLEEFYGTISKRTYLEISEWEIARREGYKQ